MKKKKKKITPAHPLFITLTKPANTCSKQLALRQHQLPDGPIVRESTHRKDIVQGRRRRRGAVELVLRLEAAVVRVPRVGLLLLPEPPEAVDLGVVEEEDGVYIPTSTMRVSERQEKPFSSRCFFENQYVPFGDVPGTISPRSQNVWPHAASLPA